MKLMLKISILSLLCIFSLYAHAQVPVSLDGITIAASTENPKPGEKITISLESFNSDLSSASIVWIVDGKTYTQGVGLSKITVQAGKIGVAMTIAVAIKTAEGREVRKSLTIKSGSVDIIWETKGYTPPFFKGKLPLVYQNTVHLVAVPHLSNDGIKEVDPKNLVYKWKMDGKYIPNGQGYGVQTVDVELGAVPKPLAVEVEVYTREQTQNTFASLTIQPTDPSLLFYEDNSLYGLLFNRSLSERVPLRNEEMKIRVVPFGFNINPLKDSNAYSWSINDIDQPDLLKKQSITIRTKGDTEGSSNIGLSIRNEDAILQGARGGFTVYFSKKQEAAENNGAVF